MAENNTFPGTENQATQPAAAIPAPPEPKTSFPVMMPLSLFNKLVPLSVENGVDMSTLCVDLIQKAVNIQLLSSGTINDLSEEAQDIFRTVSLEAVLDGLRIYNVPKAAPTVTESSNPDVILSDGEILFTTTPDVKDLVRQINEHRIKKGLAPIEKSICELLYHYGLTMGDYHVCQDVTGMSYNKFTAVFKTLGLNEREQNGAQSNLIDTGMFLSKFDIVDTPDAVLPALAASPAPDAKDKK